jgi:hypothetical protein
MPLKTETLHRVISLDNVSHVQLNVNRVDILESVAVRHNDTRFEVADPFVQADIHLKRTFVSGEPTHNRFLVRHGRCVRLEVGVAERKYKTANRGGLEKVMSHRHPCWLWRELWRIAHDGT